VFIAVSLGLRPYLSVCQKIVEYTYNPNKKCVSNKSCFYFLRTILVCWLTYGTLRTKRRKTEIIEIQRIDFVNHSLTSCANYLEKTVHMKFVRTSCVAALIASFTLLSASVEAACPFSIAALSNTAMLSDGLLFFRAAGVAQGSSITASTGSAITADAALNSIAAKEVALDVNGNDRFDLDDAAIIIRYLAGFRGAALAASAPDATRRTGGAVEKFINDGCVATACDVATGRVLEVGAGKTYATPRAAAAVAVNGDVVKISAANYVGDVATWSANNLTICGVGGRAKLFANGVNEGGKAIWVIRGNDVVIDGIEFHNATVPDQNGAGIRTEGVNLTINNSGFYDNENGILGGSAGIITVKRSEFARNGFGDGQSHNLYINAVDQLNVYSSFFHEAKIGHNLKSRAKKTRIENSYFMDGPNGTASYQVDFSNGGAVYLRGNLFQKGPNADNSIAIAYGQEGLAAAPNTLEMIHNTVVMTRAGGAFIVARSGTQSVTLTANLFAGTNGPALFTGTFPPASAVLSGNFTPTASNIPGADNIAAPNFWPNATLAAQINLANPLDASYTRDAPRPFQVRRFVSPNRVAGAVQSSP
jgi:hypothetical protein